MQEEARSIRGRLLDKRRFSFCPDSLNFIRLIAVEFYTDKYTDKDSWRMVRTSTQCALLLGAGGSPFDSGLLLDRLPFSFCPGSLNFISTVMKTRGGWSAPSLNKSTGSPDRFGGNPFESGSGRMFPVSFFLLWLAEIAHTYCGRILYR